MHIDESALTLQEAADRLHLSYSAIFAKRHQIGFRLPGSRIWRVWPSRLAELSAPRSNVTRLSLRVAEGNSWQSEKTKRPASGTLTSARQMVNEFDALLKREKEKLRRNTTTA